MRNTQSLIPTRSDIHLASVESVEGDTSFSGAARDSAANRKSLSFVQFVIELRRRKVCRAITMYFVAMWVVSQVVQLISPQLGLPEWALSLVIVLGLIGFPIAIALSWLFELTPQGVVVDIGTEEKSTTDVAPRRVWDKAIDCSLLLAALVIGSQLVLGVFGTDSRAEMNPITRVAIIPFQTTSADVADALAQSLVIDLHHEILDRTSLVAVAPQAPYMSSDGVSLTGSVAVTNNLVRVTTMLIENKTGEIVWSSIFQHENVDSSFLSAILAEEIVLAFPVTLLVTELSGGNHES